MIRNLLISSVPKRLCQIVTHRQYSRTQNRQSFLIGGPSTWTATANTTVLFPGRSLNLIARTMSTGDGRDLFYDDILKLSSQKDVVLVDVREPDEIKETGLLPGSVHIPLGEVPDALKASAEDFKKKYGIDKPAQNTQLIFSCRSGKRSRMALTKALEQGYANSKHYAGGWLDWESKTKQ